MQDPSTTSDSCTDRESTTDRTGDSDSSDYPPLDEPLGPAEITIDLPREVAREAYRAYRQYARAGYTEPFEVFVFNHVTGEWSATVEGEPLAEALSREDLDGEAIDRRGADD